MVESYSLRLNHGGKHTNMGADSDTTPAQLQVDKRRLEKVLKNVTGSFRVFTGSVVLSAVGPSQVQG